MRKINIRAKLVMLVLVVLIPVCLLYAVDIQRGLESHIEGELKASEDFARAIKVAFLNYVEKIWFSQLAIGEHLVAAPWLSNNEIEAHLIKLAQDEPTVMRFSWIDPDGTVIASSQKEVKGLNFAEREYIQRVIQGEEKVITGLVVSKYSNEAIIPISRGIRNDKGELLGIVVAIVDRNRLGLVLPDYRSGITSKFGIIDNKGMLVYRNGNWEIGTIGKVSEQSPAWQALRGEVVKTIQKNSSFDDISRVGVDYPIEQLGWECFVSISVHEVLESQIETRNRAVGILILVAVSSLLVSLILAKRFTEPIISLQMAASAIAEGKYSARAAVSNSNEFEETLRTFNLMAEELEKNVQGTANRLQTIFNNALLSIVIETKDRDIVKLNPTFEKLIGYSEKELRGKSWADVTHPDDLEKDSRLFEKIKDGTLDHFQLDKRYISKDGRIVWGHLSVVASRDSKGQTTGIIVFINDISDKKLMEEKIIRLDQLNLIGQMAAGISHEVRNPLTTVRGYLQLFSRKENCAPYREHFALMIDELDRANNIISEFLSIGKSRPTSLAKHNLNSIIQTILPLLEASASKQEKFIKADLHPVAELMLDDREIRQVILNLTANGFEAMNKGGLLTIQTFMEDSHVVFSVKDEGEGIKPEILDKLGTPFLTTKANGTGLGLGVCYSIVHRHNGEISVKTGITGTTFRIRFKT